MNDKDLAQIQGLLTVFAVQIGERIEAKLAEHTAQFDAKLDARFAEQTAAFDAKLDVRFAGQAAAFDAKFAEQAAAFDAKFAEQAAAFDAKFAEHAAAFDAKLAALSKEIHHWLDLQQHAFQRDINLLVDGHQMLAEKIDRVEAKLDAVDQKLTRRLDLIAADLAAHKVDPNAHPAVYRVREKEEPFE